MIRFSTPQRDSYFSIDIKKVDAWYKALKLFVTLIYDHRVQFKLKPGIVISYTKKNNIITVV